MSENAKKLGVAGWTALIVLLAFLGWALWYGLQAWNALEGVGISTTGWIFLFLGVFVTILVGAGLMGLVFYSSRKNFDR